MNLDNLIYFMRRAMDLYYGPYVDQLAALYGMSRYEFLRLVDPK